MRGQGIPTPLVRPVRAHTRHPTQNPGLGMKSLQSVKKIATKEFLAEGLGEIRSQQTETALKSPTSISLPSGPTQWLFERPPRKSKFLAARWSRSPARARRRRWIGRVKCSLISAWTSWCLSSKGGFEIFFGKNSKFPPHRVSDRL